MVGWASWARRRNLSIPQVQREALRYVDEIAARPKGDCRARFVVEAPDPLVPPRLVTVDAEELDRPAVHEELTVLADVNMEVDGGTKVVITGESGSGKTTLLLEIARRLAAGSQKIAIIENEVGEVGIDGQYLRQEGLEVQEMFGGCVCCTLSVDLITTLKKLDRSAKLRLVGR